mmetsp:Transcript_2720/g.7568  ORF Transcript_2720/g.7568 Transcript_2720/m.7568 type:complete len:131 (+) Transcript_2720:455-847(+)
MLHCFRVIAVSAVSVILFEDEIWLSYRKKQIESASNAILIVTLLILLTKFPHPRSMQANRLMQVVLQFQLFQSLDLAYYFPNSCLLSCPSLSISMHDASLNEFQTRILLFIRHTAQHKRHAAVSAHPTQT